jgi:hypothetical protein
MNSGADQIIISSGLYRETVRINRNVTLIGNNNTRIRRDNGTPAIIILSGTVNISNVKVEQNNTNLIRWDDGGAEFTTDEAKSDGIILSGGNLTLSNVEISSFSLGIACENATLTVSGSNLHHNLTAVELESCPNSSFGSTTFSNNSESAIDYDVRPTISSSTFTSNGVNEIPFVPPDEENPPISLPAGSDKKGTVFAWYYQWYNDSQHGSPVWHHWNQGTSNPPNLLSSWYYPLQDEDTGNAYSSKDTDVIDDHLLYMENAGIDVIILDYWGPTSYSASNIQAVLNRIAATQSPLKVAFVIDKNKTGMRPIRDIKPWIDDIFARWGTSQHLFKAARKTRRHPVSMQRPVIFLWASASAQIFCPASCPEYPDPRDRCLCPQADTWAKLLGPKSSNPNSVRGTSKDAFYLWHGFSFKGMNRNYFDGIFEYQGGTEQYADRFCGAAHQLEVTRCKNGNCNIYVPSASPGFNNTWGGAETLITDRDEGNYFTARFSYVNDTSATWASVDSFNEYHEGSQIERTRQNVNRGGRTYLDFNGHFEVTGNASRSIYEEVTLEMVTEFKQSRNATHCTSD